MFHQNFEEFKIFVYVKFCYSKFGNPNIYVECFFECFCVCMLMIVIMMVFLWLSSTATITTTTIFFCVCENFLIYWWSKQTNKQTRSYGHHHRHEKYRIFPVVVVVVVVIQVFLWLFDCCCRWCYCWSVCNISKKADTKLIKMNEWIEKAKKFTSHKWMNKIFLKWCCMYDWFLIEILLNIWMYAYIKMEKIFQNKNFYIKIMFMNHLSNLCINRFFFWLLTKW